MNALKIDATLQTRFDRQFAAAPYLRGFNAQVWSDGGEWPVFDSIKRFTRTRNPRFLWPSDAMNGRDVDHVIRATVENFKTRADFAISMTCGAGKSTRLMATLLERSSFATIICIVPSSVAADELTGYVSKINPNLLVSRRYAMNVKSLVYMSASEFLVLMHSSILSVDALIVVDEYHSINPVYKAMSQILNCVNNKILCMTASNSSDLSKREGVFIHAHIDFDDKLKSVMDAIQRGNESTALIMGCSPGYQIYRASNHYVGVTLTVKTIVDFATRLNPTVKDNSLVMTYRVASVTEITQSLGRLARVVGSSGQFHYLKNSSPFTLTGHPMLYSRIYEALISAFGMGLESNVKSLNATLRCASDFVVSSSARSVTSSRKDYDTAPSVTHSNTRTASSSTSCASSVRPARDSEVMKVHKLSSGYRVDYVPKDPIRRALSFRACTWTANPPIETFPNSAIRQNNLLNTMNSSSFISDSASSNVSLSPEHIVHPADMQSVNDILSGKSIPTYSSDEFDLIKRAWAVYLQLNPIRTSQASIQIERNISSYYEAYKRMTNIFSKSSPSS